MPLSEQEQRLLEEMERNLYQNDSDFVSAVGARVGKINYTVVVTGALLVVAGIATLITGVMIALPVVGVLGFIVMFSGVLVATSRPRPAAAAPRAQNSSQRAKSSSFMDGMNERWEKRQEERGN